MSRGMSGVVTFIGWCIWNMLIWSIIPYIGFIGIAHIGTGSPGWGWPMLIFSVANILLYIWVNHGWRIRDAHLRHEMKSSDNRTKHLFSMMTQEQIDAINNFDPVTGEPLPTSKFVHESVPEIRNGHKFYRMGEPDHVFRFGKHVSSEFPLSN